MSRGSLLSTKLVPHPTHLWTKTFAQMVSGRCLASCQPHPPSALPPPFSHPHTPLNTRRQLSGGRADPAPPVRRPSCASGALITGLSNKEVAVYLLGLDNGDPHPTLPSSFHGVVFIDEEGSKKILLRQTQDGKGSVCYGRGSKSCTLSEHPIQSPLK